MSKSQLIVICHTNLGTSLSGGDRIFLNLIKCWRKHFRITTVGSAESRKLVRDFKVNTQFICSTPSHSITLNTFNLIFHHASRFISGLVFSIKHRSLFTNCQYIYTASDFYGDFIFGVVAKIFNPKIKWLCGYYLLAPPPWSNNSPYNHNHQYFRGLVYYLAQIPTKLIAHHLADFVMVTSVPDLHFFPHHSVVVRGGVSLPSTTAIKKLASPTHRHYHGFYLGRLHSQKGVIGLIDIWKLVCQQIPTAKLAIVGDGELEPEIRQKINTYGLADNITLFGYLVGPKKFSIIKNSQIVLHPATYDSGGMAAAEAMAWGLPGIAYDLPALKTYYPQGMMKVEPFDQVKFANTIVKLLQHPDKYRQLSRQARQLALKHWGWHHRFEEIYRQINDPE